MKRFTLTLFVFIIAYELKSGDQDTLIQYSAKQIYYQGFQSLKELDFSQSQYFIRNFDNVSGWNDFKYMVFGYPIDTVGKSYSCEREKYLQEFYVRTKFFFFPIETDSIRLNCFVLSCTDTINVHYYRLLKLFYYNPKDSLKEPTLLLNYRELNDGFSRIYENSEFTLFSNNDCFSKFCYTREAIDILLLDSKPNLPDTVTIFVKMKYNETNGLITVNKDFIILPNFRTAS